MKGSIQLAIGPMFSGKTEWLIEKLLKDKNAIAIRFEYDMRYSQNKIVSHKGNSFPAFSAKTTDDIFQLINKRLITTIGLDEVQFYDNSLVKLLLDLRKSGKTVLTAGLDTDYQRNEWETTKKISEKADKIYSLKAICSICHKKNAIYTTRTSQVKARVVIGGNEVYSARCEEHYAV